MRKPAAAALLALAALACRGENGPAVDRQQDATVAAATPELALLTALPIAFAEGFNLDAAAHPAMAELEKNYSVRLVDGPADLTEGGLLLAAQPQALTAERLVELDRWIRRGGRLLLLADPSFTWESSRPLGDKFRPPYAFPDTGLLAHWDLQLESERVPKTEVVERRIGDATVFTGSPGILSSSSGSCRVQPDGFVATCKLGKGRADVIADADFVMHGGQAEYDALIAVLNSLR